MKTNRYSNIAPLLAVGLVALAASSASAQGTCTSMRVSQESSPGLGDFDANVLGCIDPYATGLTGAQYYAYNGSSFNGPAPTLTNDRAHLFLVNGSDGMSVFSVLDGPDMTGGKAEMSFTLFGDGDGAVRTIEDGEPFTGDMYTGNPGDNIFTSRHLWSSFTDGEVISDLEGAWSMEVVFTPFVPSDVVIQGLNSWVAYSSTGATFALNLVQDRRVRLDCCPAPISLAVSRGAGSGDIVLSWTGGESCSGVYRSPMAPTVLDPPNRLGETAGDTWLDLGAGGNLCFYNVVDDCSASPEFDTAWFHTIGDPDLSGEQEPPGSYDGRSPAPKIGPVAVHSGEVRFQLELPAGSIHGRGENDWDAPLTYRSQISYHGRVGMGWNLPLLTDRAVTMSDGLLLFRGRDGRFDLYDDVTRSAPGYFDTYDDTSMPGFAIFREPEGTTRIYRDFMAGNAAGMLAQIEDRNGNLLEFNHDTEGKVTDAVDDLGRQIAYFYDGAGHLMTVRDWQNRDTALAYDAEGRLVSVTTPTVTGTPTGNDFPMGKTYEIIYEPSCFDVMYCDGTGAPYACCFDEAECTGAGVPEACCTGMGTGNCAGVGTCGDGSCDDDLRANIAEIRFPNETESGGPARIKFAYGTNPGDPLTFDRVIAMDVGGGGINNDPETGQPLGVPAGGTWTFVYQDLNARVAGDLTTEVRQVTVTDPNGNVTDYFFNSFFHEVRRVVQTNRNINSQDPASFTGLKTWNADSLLTSVTYPEGNQILYTYDGASPNRFSQGNLLTVTEFPDGARSGDQPQLVTDYTYEPIYNRVRTITTPRGNDAAYVPPIVDNPANVVEVDFNLDGDVNDPSDGESTRAYRYTTIHTYDYQEGSPTDIQNLATAEGVTVTGTSTQALALDTDLNGDGTTAQQAGNPIEIRRPNVILPDGAFQEIRTTNTYDEFGRLTSSADPEGNLKTVYYYPETDPDGNGMSEGLVRGGLSTVSGGYVRMIIGDDDPALAATPAGDPERPQNQPVTNGGTARRTRTAPFTKIRNTMTYDPVGNLTSLTNGRGIRTDYTINELDQVVQVTRAAAHNQFTPEPVEPVSLSDFQYLERLAYDANDNVIRRQVEDRGDTSTVGGDNAGSAFVDHVYRYDLLDNLIEVRNEVDDSTDLVTLHRYDPNGNAVLMILPEGNASSTIYDERDLLFRVARGATSPPALTLLAAGDPGTYDPRGGTPATTTYTYDGNGNLVELADADDTDGNNSNDSPIAGAGDRRWRATYDGYDRLTSTVDAMGNQAVTQYDPDDLPQRTLNFGPTTCAAPVAPDPLARPVSVNGAIQSGNLVSTSLLSATENLPDELQRFYQRDRVLFINTISTPFAADVADGAGDIGKDNLTPGDNASIPGLAGPTILGRVSTRNIFDRNSMPVSLVEDDLDTIAFEYDGMDRLIRTTDAEGNMAETAYDDESNVIERRETDVSQVVAVADEQFLTTYFYDSLDRLERSVDNLGQTNDFRYDSRNNLVAMADAQGPVNPVFISRRAFTPPPPGTNDNINDFGNVTRYDYDGLNRRLQQEVVLTVTGDGDGVNIGATSEGVKTTIPTPDLAQGGGDGLVTLVTTWDDNSLVATMTDDNGNETQYGYDNLNRRISETQGTCTLPNLADRCDTPTTKLWAYDPDDNPIQTDDENGTTVVCQFDAIDRRTSCTATPAAGVTGSTIQSWCYDGSSRLVETDDNNEPGDALDDVEVLRAYDSLDRVFDESQQIGVGTPRRVRTAWRAEDLRSALIYPNGRQVDLRYDLDDRLDTIRDNGAVALLADYEYLGKNRVVERRHTLPGGPVTDVRLTHLNDAGTVDIGYDGLRRPIELRHLRDDNSLIAGFVYGYNRLNNRLGEVKQHDAVNVEDYTLDSAQRLIDFDRSSASAGVCTTSTGTICSIDADCPGVCSASICVQGDIGNQCATDDDCLDTCSGATGVAQKHGSFDLDGAGNWTAVDSETRDHTSFNELYEFQQAGMGPVALDYDDNGNLIADGRFSYEWDYKNRLRRVIRNSDVATIAEYTYDADGRRMRKIVSNTTQLNGETHYVYDDRRVLEERDDLDILLQQYVYGNYIDEPVVLDQNLDGDSDATEPFGIDRRLFYHENASNSTHALTDFTASIVEGYQYDAYGLPTVYEPGPNTVVDFGGDDLNVKRRSALDNPYLFTGRRLDPETGQFSYRARYMNPNYGRFLSRDPIGIWGDGASLGNGYAYVSNSPSNGLDPFGTYKTEPYGDLDTTWTCSCNDGYQSTLVGFDETGANAECADTCNDGHGGFAYTEPVSGSSATLDEAAIVYKPPKHPRKLSKKWPKPGIALSGGAPASEAAYEPPKHPRKLSKNWPKPGLAVSSSAAASEAVYEPPKHPRKLSRRWPKPGIAVIDQSYLSGHRRGPSAHRRHDSPPWPPPDNATILLYRHIRGPSQHPRKPSKDWPKPHKLSSFSFQDANVSGEDVGIYLWPWHNRSCSNLHDRKKSKNWPKPDGPCYSAGAPAF